MFGKKKVASQRIYKTNLIKFQFLYKINKLWIKLVIAAIIGLFYAIATTLFVKNTSLYTGGTGAFFFGIARLTQTVCLSNHMDKQIATLIYNILFWGLYLIFNIPLFFLAYKFVGKKFAIISMTFLVFNQVSGFLFGLIPNFNLSLFGHTENVYDYLHNEYQIDTIVLNLKIFPTSEAFTSNEMIQPWQWVSEINSTNREYANTLINSNYVRAVALFLYAIFFSIISAVSFSMLFILGGSSAGSDFITVWYSIKKHKEIGKIYSVINATFLIIGVVLGSYITGIIVWQQIVEVSSQHNVNLKEQFKSNPFAGIEYFFSANLLASLCWILFNGLLIERLFPNGKIVQCDVSSKIINVIDEKIFQGNEFNIVPFARRLPTDVKFICSYFEFTQVMKQIKEIDPDCLVVSGFIKDIDGNIDMYKNKFKD